MQIEKQTVPILLFNDECGVCRIIAHWVQKSARTRSADTRIIVRPIGEDPEDLRSLNPALSIWDAYATIHLLMPDGSMKLGGEAVAAVLRNLSSTRWFAWMFAISVFGFRPFQAILNLAYLIQEGEESPPPGIREEASRIEGAGRHLLVFGQLIGEETGGVHGDSPDSAAAARECPERGRNGKGWVTTRGR